MSHPYAPYRPFSYIDYQVFKTTGRWHPEIMALDVLSREPIPHDAHGFQRITAIQSGGLTGLVYGDGGVPCNHLAGGFPNGVLFDELEPNGVAERAAGWGVGDPGVLILPNDLTVGHQINTLTRVWSQQWMTRDGVLHPLKDADTLGPGQVVTARELPDFPSRCRVNYRGSWEGTKYPDVVMSALWERPGEAESYVYNYVWALGIGLVDFWYGKLAPDGSVDGIQYYGVAHGG